MFFKSNHYFGLDFFIISQRSIDLEQINSDFEAKKRKISCLPVHGTAGLLIKE
jgi:hypothetical protein